MEVHFDKEGIGIREEVEAGGRELIYWHREEWIEDPDLVFVIVNAVNLAKVYPEGLRRKLADARRKGDGKGEQQ